MTVFGFCCIEKTFPTRELNNLKFIDLLDVTQLMRRIAETMDEEDPFYTDFKFFSAINYTTQSEYRQELKKFLKEFVIENGMFVEEKFIEDLKALYCWL